MRFSTVFSLAAAAVISSPALAQQVPAADTGLTAPVPDPAPQLSYEQQLMLNGWPVAHRAQYEAWPAIAQSYYWSLAPERQNLFWRFTDHDKERLALMTPDEKLASWAAVDRALAAQRAAAMQSVPIVQDVPESTGTPMP